MKASKKRDDEIIILEEGDIRESEPADFDISLEDFGLEEKEVKEEKEEKPKKEVKKGFLAGLKKKKKEEEKICKYGVSIKGDQRALNIDCFKCDHAVSSLGDEICRKNILRILVGEPSITRLSLSHLSVREYEGASLHFLMELAKFIENSDAYKHADLKAEYKEKLEDIFKKMLSDPINAYFSIRKELEANPPDDDYLQVLEEIRQIGKSFANLSPDRGSKYYTDYIRPYVRPRFSSSRIYTEPPKNTVFVKSYTVQKSGGRPIKVTIYRLTDRPENLYFIFPSEYSLETHELELLERAKSKLIKFRPKDTRFADPSRARNYFMRQGKHLIGEIAKEMKIKLTPKDIHLLSDIFAKYTAGLGIIEDILTDDRVQDVYVNAPVSRNPLHVVIDDEECITNVYLSEDDLDAMISRFRSISGRPFSEATPILDMGLEEYHTRISVIGSPLSQKGLAYAFRRHRKEPWTLPMLMKYKMLSPLGAGLLSFLMDGQSTVLVAGDVGAGKTSLLISMLLEIPQKYRILTIEDTPEIPIEKLQLLGWKVQGMSTQSAIGGAGAEVRPEVALRAALRLGNSALVLGEVRGPEVKTLYEAMQVGSAGNSVIGTIHGASTEAVYERIVQSLGVPVQSFKVTDAIIVCARVREAGSMKKRRRITQISEIVKSKWSESPSPQEIFADIMLLDTGRDHLAPTDILDMGQSEVVKKIAGKWGISVDKALENIRVRAAMKETILKYGLDNSSLLEADAVSRANNMFWLYVDQNQAEHGTADYAEVYDQWILWYEDFIKSYRKDAMQ
jgi:type IV secretory pathway ATPase VirB11/archaellum biosynthesis ATPase